MLAPLLIHAIQNVCKCSGMLLKNKKADMLIILIVLRSSTPWAVQVDLPVN